MRAWLLGTLKVFLHYLRIGLFSIPVGAAYGWWVVRHGESWVALIVFVVLGLLFAIYIESIVQHRKARP